MDTWFVGRQPIGLYKQASTKGQEDTGFKVIFINKNIVIQIKV